MNTLVQLMIQDTKRIGKELSLLVQAQELYERISNYLKEHNSDDLLDLKNWFYSKEKYSLMDDLVIIFKNKDLAVS